MDPSFTHTRYLRHNSPYSRIRHYWIDNEAARAKTITKNTNSTQNKRQTYRAKQYKVTSFLSTDCELSTETCSKNVYSLGPRHVIVGSFISNEFNDLIFNMEYAM